MKYGAFPQMELMEAIGGNARLPRPLFITLFALTDFDELKGDSGDRSFPISTRS